MPAAPAWHASPSALNGVAMQLDEIGERMSASAAPAGRVELEGIALEVPDERLQRPADVLDPGDVGRVAREGDVGARGVVDDRRDRLAVVDQLEVVAADQARDEDLMVPPTRCPRSRSPTAPSCRRASCVPAATRGSSASWPGRVQRALVLGPLGSGGLPKPARGVQDVGLPRGAVAHGLPVEATGAGAGVGDGLGREDLLVVCAARWCRSRSPRTRRPTARCRRAPVKAKSGLTPSRVGSMLRHGSPCAEVQRRASSA